MHVVIWFWIAFWTVWFCILIIIILNNFFSYSLWIVPWWNMLRWLVNRVFFEFLIFDNFLLFCFEFFTDFSFLLNWFFIVNKLLIIFFRYSLTLFSFLTQIVLFTFMIHFWNIVFIYWLIKLLNLISIKISSLSSITFFVHLDLFLLSSGWRSWRNIFTTIIFSLSYHVQHLIHIIFLKSFIFFCMVSFFTLSLRIKRLIFSLRRIRNKILSLISSPYTISLWLLINLFILINLISFNRSLRFLDYSFTLDWSSLSLIDTFGRYLIFITVFTFLWLTILSFTFETYLTSRTCRLFLFVVRFDIQFILIWWKIILVFLIFTTITSAIRFVLLTFWANILTLTFC